MTMFKALLATIALLGAFTAHADSFSMGPDRNDQYDRHDRHDGYGRNDQYDRGDRYGRWENSECRDAIANLRYCQQQFVYFRDLAQNGAEKCQGRPMCRVAQFKALQYTIEQLQKAERHRQEVCEQ